MSHVDDEKDEKRRFPPLGDIGTIALAAVFLLGMVATIAFLFSSPEPIRDLFGKKPPEKDSGVVMIPIQQKN